MHLSIRQKKLISVAVFLALLTGAYFAVMSSFFITRVVLPIVSTFTGVSIRAAHMELDYWNRRLSARGLEIGNPDFPLVRAREAALTYDLGKLINYDVWLRDVEMTDGEINLVRGFSGFWNYEDLLGVDNTWFIRPDDPDFHWDIRGVKGRNVAINCVIEQPTRRIVWRWSGLNIDMNAFGNDLDTALRVRGRASISCGDEIELENGAFDLTFDAKTAANLIPYDMNLLLEANYASGHIGRAVNGGYDARLAIRTVRDGGRMLIKEFEFSGGALNAEAASRLKLSGFLEFFPFGTELKIVEGDLDEGILTLLGSSFLQLEPGKAKVAAGGEFVYRADEEHLTSRFSLKLERRGPARFGESELALPDFNLEVRSDFAADLKENELKLNDIYWSLRESGDAGSVVFRLKEPVTLNCTPGARGKTADFALSADKLDLKLLYLLGFGQIRSGRLSGSIDSSLSGGARTLSGGGEFTVSQLAAGDLEHIDLDSRMTFVLNERGRMAVPDWIVDVHSGTSELGRLSASGEAWPFRRRGKFKLAMQDIDSAALEVLHREGKGLVLPFALKGSGIMELIVEPERAVFRNGDFTLAAVGSRTGALEFQLPELYYNYRDGLLNRNLIVPLRMKDFPAGWLRPGLHRAGFDLESGRLNGRAQLVASAEIWPWRATGELRLTDGTLRVLDRPARPVECAAVFMMTMKNPDDLEFQRLDLRMNVNGREAVRCLLPLEVQFGTGAVTGELTLTRASEQFLNLYFPDRFSSAKISGSAKVVYQPQYGMLNLDGYTDVENLSCRTPEDLTLHGSMQFNFAKSGREWQLRQSRAHFFDSHGEPAALLDMTGRSESGVDSRRNPGMLNIHLTALDIKLWYELFCGRRLSDDAPAAEPAKTAVSASENPPDAWHFDFGDSALRIAVDADNIRMGPDNRIAFSGVLVGRGGDISSEHLSLQLNECDVDATLRLFDTPEGAVFASAVVTRSGMNLRPWMLVLEGENLQDFTGELAAADWQLSGRVRFDRGFWDELRGRVFARFGKLVIPNEFGRSVIGGVILLPFTMVSAFEAITPGVDSGAVRNSLVYRTVEDFNRRLWRVNLNRGEVKLTSTGGVVAINKFLFTGDLVRSFEFTGSMRLGTDQYLKLESVLDIGGVLFPSRITGTLGDPKLEVISSILLTLWKNLTSLGYGVVGVGKWVIGVGDEEDER